MAVREGDGATGAPAELDEPSCSSKGAFSVADMPFHFAKAAFCRISLASGPASHCL
jgi:hypothetical protein